MARVIESIKSRICFRRLRAIFDNFKRIGLALTRRREIKDLIFIIRGGRVIRSDGRGCKMVGSLMIFRNDRSTTRSSEDGCFYFRRREFPG